MAAAQVMAADDEPAVTNRIYVIPPGRVATIRDGRLHLGGPTSDAARVTDAIARLCGCPIATSEPGAPDRGMVTLVVEPVPGDASDRPVLLVSEDPRLPRGEPTGASVVPAVDRPPELEQENRALREQLWSLGEKHGLALEELRSSNEELQTVNVRLSAKVDELARADADLRHLFDSTRAATLFLDRHLVIRAYTPEVCTLYDLFPSERGRPLAAVVSRLAYDELSSDVAAAMRTLQPQERRVSRRDQAGHFLARVLPYRAPGGTIDGTLVTFVDVTRIVQAEEHQRRLVNELNHRVKNMLTVVISLASQTLRRAPTLAEFTDVFLGRLQALPAAYTLVTRENWSTVLLREIVEEELEPFMAADRRNIRIDGPDVPLASRAALALGLAIHELATNAVKYGALSVPEGNLGVTWTLEDSGPAQLVLQWVECDGPAVTAPAARGFGSALVEHALAHDMSARATIDFLPAGVRATVRAPIGAASQAPVPDAGMPC